MTPETIQTIAIALAVVIVAFLGFKTFHKTASKAIDAPKELVTAGGDAIRHNIQAIGTEIRDLLGATPEITINRTVIQQAPAAVCELYFCKQSAETREQLTSKKLGSSKTLIISQKFTIKAGFDLNRLRLDFDEKNHELRATITDALLLSVENDGPFQVEKSESGWWNRISDAERDQLINSLPEKARNEIETTAIRDQAMAGLRHVLNRICERNGLRLQIDFASNDTAIRSTKTLAEPSDAIEQLGLLDPPSRSSYES
jgi:hypothetical protein